MGDGGGPDFSQSVPENGYAWWYCDAFSDDGAYGLTLIAMIGSVFSPYYARARRAGRGDPEHYSALNVALYGRGGKRWALTERGRSDLVRTRNTLKIGPSQLVWDGSALTVSVNEMTVPIPGRIRGTIKITPSALNARAFQLAQLGSQMWRPIAPCARVDVDLDRPKRRWSGHAYWDSNWGAVPLEAAFKRWTWSRASTPEETTIFYDGERRGEGPFSLALKISRDGRIETLEPPPKAALATTAVWRIPRETRSSAASQTPARVLKTFEDTPFYARSLIETDIGGSPRSAMHESLLLERFDTRWVQALLPFRMPRRAKV